jgi:YD repeat-containing protein
LKKAVVNDYTYISRNSVICGVTLKEREEWIQTGEYVPFELAPYFYQSMSDYFWWEMPFYDIIANPSFYVLDKTTITEYNSNGNIITAINYDYDSEYRLLSPVKTTITNSNGMSYVEENKYPFHYTATPYPQMVANNVIEPVVNKTKTSSNGNSISIQSNYRQEGSMFLINSVQTGKNNNFETRITYHNYDTHGNPIYLSKDNADKVVYVWGYNYQYPIAEIKNVTYAEVETAVKSVFSVASMDALSQLAIPNETKLKDGSLQKALPNAQVTTYTYKPLVGIETITDPRGVKITYHYDAFGRLQWIEDENGKKIENYEYHYKN